MREMVARRDFVKPNSLLPRSTWYSLNEQIIRDYQKAQEARKRHLSMVWRVMRDLEAAGIPISREEQKQMVFMTFYREREDIRQMVEQALHNIGKSASNYAELAKAVSRADPPFDTTTFRQLWLQFDCLDTEMLNTFLKTALRHGNSEVAEELLLSLASPNGDTFRILLDNFSMENDHRRFTETLGLLATSHTHLIDIQVLNSVIAALFRTGYSNEAVLLVNTLSPLSEPLSASEQFLKLLTASDRLRYRDHIVALHKLPSTVPVKLYATEDTLLPLLSHMCHTGSFDDIVKTLFTIEHVWGLPLTTRAFHTVFRLFRGTHSEENLRFATAKLLTECDVNVDDNESWIREKLHHTELPSGVGTNLENILAETPRTLAHIGGARFLKLSDRLVDTVLQAYEVTLHLKPELLLQIADTKAKYLQHMSAARERDVPLPKGQPPSAKDLFRRDQYMYIKKSLLIDLLDILT